MPRDRKEHLKLEEEADTELSEMPLRSSYQHLLLQTSHEFPEGSTCGQVFPYSGRMDIIQTGVICLAPRDVFPPGAAQRKDARVGNRPSKAELAGKFIQQIS